MIILRSQVLFCCKTEAGTGGDSVCGFDWRKLWFDILIDIVGGFSVGIGVYNFAANANFPLAGVSGISLIFYRLFGIPIGLMTILLNIPIVLICFRMLGKKFFLRSLKTLLISSTIMDYIVPLFPVYSGERMLAAVCTGVFAGFGYAIIFMNQSSTGGMDFVTLSVKSKKPHLSLGRIVFVSDTLIVMLGGIIFKDVDGIIYGIIITYLLTGIIDKITYGINAGKMALIVTDNGKAIAQAIGEFGRGATLLKAQGSYSGNEKEVVMCACNNKQMFGIKRMVKKVDPKAFTIIMESNEVVGEGFKES